MSKAYWKTALVHTNLRHVGIHFMAEQNNQSRITVCLHPCLAMICMSNENMYTTNGGMRNVMSNKTFNGSDSLGGSALPCLQ